MNNINMPKLRDDADLYYLLREFDTAYRYASHGGSVLIRTHMRRVRDRISRVIKENSQVQYTIPTRVPVNAHLARALDRGELDANEGFVRAVHKVADRMSWQLGYDRISPSLARKYGYADLLGPAGLIKADDIALCFLHRIAFVPPISTTA